MVEDHMMVSSDNKTSSPDIQHQSKVEDIKNIKNKFESLLNKNPVQKNNKEYTKPFIQIVSILDNGNYRFDFSETIVDLNEILPGEDVLAELNKNKNDIFEIIYQSGLINSYDEDSIDIPQIESWNFIEFNKFYFDLEINFSSPLMVSKGSEKDIL